mmetsp:Transcript_13394/g.28396  ORF Transcript_13394/g.28396 Transcript_13394/m.28396 type:complete len:254 (+) Transcript_13394:248-1009(+)|eukprot:CAMPEP_0171351016 /NCGR_PEP_ID=MMETSP0878-20121228/37904_1 /TAXON_ID=67004 /ORGANISM="Thalassiosira weissflogii, Strain CCMP1336" /LENGTH=253 /DNA_ID=CAMNT_0011856131 /DNA_START=167 /DNA_END=928 /DNA_ORIENTATION=-
MSFQFYSPLKGDDGVKECSEIQQTGGSSEPTITKMKSSPKPKVAALTPTSRNTIGNASSSISRALSASANHASKKMKSFVPQKLRIKQCLTKNNNRNTNATESQDEDDVPMIFYVDNAMISEETVEFLDPFAFEEWKIDSHEKNNHNAFPSSRALIPSDNENNPKVEGSGGDFLFDCIFPRRELNFDDSASYDFSQTIRSINDTLSITEDIKIKKTFRNQHKEATHCVLDGWDGFSISSYFKTHRWNPESTIN